MLSSTLATFYFSIALLSLLVVFIAFSMDIFEVFKVVDLLTISQLGFFQADSSQLKSG